MRRMKRKWARTQIIHFSLFFTVQSLYLYWYEDWWVIGVRKSTTVPACQHGTISKVVLRIVTAPMHRQASQWERLRERALPS